MDERRYGEDEIAEIFEAAAAPRDSRHSGLTLEELQAIGRDVGVPPERIAEAASAIDVRRNALPRRTHLGMPLSVGRTVDLPRPPTDGEWELLVGELRRTFHAGGKDGSRGNLRAWTNGNLHAYVEPTEAGYRFRIGSLKGDAALVTGMGIGGMLLGVFTLGELMLTGPIGGDPLTAVFLGGMGAAALLYNRIRLPRWAREREAQMEHIAGRVQALVRIEPGPDVAEGNGDR